jgi:transcriptional regulator with XRE-family HTH domain
MMKTKWHEALDVRARGMTQAKIAELLGVQQPQVSRYLKWHDVPGLPVLLRASEHLGIAVSLAADPSDPSDDASQSETPQGERTSSIPPRSESEHASASPAGEAA